LQAGALRRIGSHLFGRLERPDVRARQLEGSMCHAHYCTTSI
jgi:hypothetical protein